MLQKLLASIFIFLGTSFLPQNEKVSQNHIDCIFLNGQRVKHIFPHYNSLALHGLVPLRCITKCMTITSLGSVALCRDCFRCKCLF